MNYTLEQYRELQPVTLPMKLKSGLTVTELKGQCPTCSGFLESMRGTVIEREQCSELKFAGLCRPCKLLVTCQLRYYKGGRCIQQGSAGWETMEVESPFWWRLRGMYLRTIRRLRRLFR